MHLPMSRSEIATFLGLTASQVEFLWSSGQLRKTLSCPYRPVDALNYSSVYDVLEFTLATCETGSSLQKHIAAIWIELMAEAEDYCEIQTASVAQRANYLLNAAIEAGIAGLSPNPISIARGLVVQQKALVHACNLVRPIPS